METVLGLVDWCSCKPAKTLALLYCDHLLSDRGQPDHTDTCNFSSSPSQNRPPHLKCFQKHFFQKPNQHKICRQTNYFDPSIIKKKDLFFTAIYVMDSRSRCCYWRHTTFEFIFNDHWKNMRLNHWQKNHQKLIKSYYVFSINHSASRFLQITLASKHFRPHFPWFFK